MKVFVQRVLLVGFGLMLAAVALEGLLRLAAAILPQRLQRAVTRQERPPEPGEIRILCVGDSHTYGVGVEPQDSYPAQLEAVLRARGIPARVVNAGVPGMNSAQLLEQLPQKLAEYQPQIVMIWVGANNQWLPIDEESAQPVVRWRDRLRILRLLRLLFTRTEGVSGDFRRDLDVAMSKYGQTAQQFGKPGSHQLRSAEVTAGITARDIPPIADLVRKAGAVPVLLTYPVTLGPMQTAIDRAIVDAGAANQIQVIDLRVMARRHQPRIPKLLLRDMHPAARFYRAIGWEIARTFIRDGLVKPPAARAVPAAAP